MGNSPSVLPPPTPDAKAIASMRNDEGVVQGVVRIRPALEGGGIVLDISIWGQTPGKHGFHLHRYGIDPLDGTCDGYGCSAGDHFSTSASYHHGALNDPTAHDGDLGNLVVDIHGNCKTIIHSKYLSIDPNAGAHTTIYGRTLIFHEGEDDLGRGRHRDSKINGHSGKRLLVGIVGYASK